MDQLKIAIFGSSGAIGSALCKKYIQQENVAKVYCFSRQTTEVKHEKAHCFILDYLDEENLSIISSEINFKMYKELVSEIIDHVKDSDKNHLQEFYSGCDISKLIEEQ